MSRLTTTSVASQANYTLSALAFDVDAPVSYLSSGGTTRVPIEPMSRDEYMQKPDRTSTASVPSQYFIEKTLSGGRVALTMYLYPVPVGSGDTIEYAAALRSKDFTDGATNPDFPSSWTNCLKWGLSALLAPSYAQAPLVMVFKPLFEEAREKLLGADNEKQGITFVPFGSGSY